MTDTAPAPEIKTKSPAPHSIIVCADALAALREIPDASIDAVVCDPPYGLSSEPDPQEVLRHWLAGDDYTHRGGGFMGKSWDSFVPGPSVWAECLRVLRPGGHLLAFAGSRTQDLMGLAIRLAGFEMRDTLQWLYGSGFPKSMDVSKAIDKMAGAEREVVGTKLGMPGYSLAESKPEGHTIYGKGLGGSGDPEAEVVITAPATDEAKTWEGWGTALKPAYEPIIMARKPLARTNERGRRVKATVAQNVLEHGTGALNIDATRIGTNDRFGGGANASKTDTTTVDFVEGYERGDGWVPGNPAGRWPANVLLTHHEDCTEVGTKTVQSNGHYPAARPGATTITTTGHGGQDGLEESYTKGETVPVFDCHEDCPVRLLDEQTGTLTSGKAAAGGHKRTAENMEKGSDIYGGGRGISGTSTTDDAGTLYGDSGGASRFFYNSKTSKRERNAGMPEGKVNNHPTVKPVAVMEWLVKMVTPPGGTVLDPFMGSGSTGVAALSNDFEFIGIDSDPASCNIAFHRIRHATSQGDRP